MSEFVLSLDPSLAGRSTYGISATFSRVADPHGTPVHSKPLMLSFPDTGSVNLPMVPGIYIMEAFLPGGEVVDRQYTLADETSVVPVRLTPPASEQLLDESMQPRLGMAHDFKYPSAGGMSGFGHDNDDPEVHIEFKCVEDHDPHGEWANILQFNSAYWCHSRTFVDELTSAHGAFRISSYSHPKTRCWSQVTRRGESRVASLPFEPFPGPMRTVEISRSDFTHRLINLVDDRVGMILGYLADGHVGAASQILDRIENEVRSSMDNEDFASAAYRTVKGPIPLCAAAYAASARRGDDSWDGVAFRLMKEEWLPDGAVLAGRSYLYDGSGEEGWERAAHCFRTAVRRGVPYFSLGLLYLYDGLTVLADYDASLKTELEAVTTVAKRSSRGEAFTVLNPGDR